MKCCAAIIVAAGSSRRAGFDKLLAPLHGVKVLERSIRAFANCREITEIVVVCPEERFRAIDAADLETEYPSPAWTEERNGMNPCRTAWQPFSTRRNLWPCTTERAPSSR